jgi:WD40 repeat protein
VAKLGHFVKDLMGHDGQLYVSTIFGLTRLDPDRGTFEVEVPRGARRAGVAGDRRWVLANDGSVLDQSGEPTPWHSVGDLAAADRFLAVAPTNDSLAVIDVDSAQTAWSGQVAGEPWALALSPDGSELAYALDDHRVRLVDLSTGTTTLLDGVHRSFVADLQFSPSGRRLASVSWDGTSRIWREGRLEAALEAHGGRATTAAFLTDDMLYTGSWDQTLRRWDLSAWGDPLIP